MRNLLTILGATFRQLAASKKVVTAVSTLVTAALAVVLLPAAQKYGLPVSEDTIAYIVAGIFGTGGAAVLGQGLQDKGKEAALIDAIADDPDTPTVPALAARGLLGFSNDTLITLGVQAFLGQIKGPNKQGKIRKTAAEITKQCLIAYADDPEFRRAVRPYLFGSNDS